MILFELKCTDDHRFEAWFRDGATYERQAEAGEIVCPHCGDTDVEKALMAPRLLKSSAERAARDQARAEKLRSALLEVRQHVESNCENVGERFAEEARKIHYGEVEARGIYGDATSDEAEALLEEGIAFGRIPWVDHDA